MRLAIFSRLSSCRIQEDSHLLVLQPLKFRTEHIQFDCIKVSGGRNPAGCVRGMHALDRVLSQVDRLHETKNSQDSD